MKIVSSSSNKLQDIQADNLFSVLYTNNIGTVRNTYRYSMFVSTKQVYKLLYNHRELIHIQFVKIHFISSFQLHF